MCLVAIDNSLAGVFWGTLPDLGPICAMSVIGRIIGCDKTICVRRFQSICNISHIVDPSVIDFRNDISFFQSPCLTAGITYAPHSCNGCSRVNGADQNSISIIRGFASKSKSWGGTWRDCDFAFSSSTRLGKGLTCE